MCKIFRNSDFRSIPAASSLSIRKLDFILSVHPAFSSLSPYGLSRLFLYPDSSRLKSDCFLAEYAAHFWRDSVPVIRDAIGIRDDARYEPSR